MYIFFLYSYTCITENDCNFLCLKMCMCSILFNVIKFDQNLFEIFYLKEDNDRSNATPYLLLCVKWKCHSIHIEK